MPVIDAPYAFRKPGPRPKKARKVKARRTPPRAPTPVGPSPDARDVTARSPAQKRRDRRAVRENIRTARERVRTRKIAAGQIDLLPRARPLRRTEVAPNPDQREPGDVLVARLRKGHQPSRAEIEDYKASPEYTELVRRTYAEHHDDEDFFKTHERVAKPDERAKPPTPQLPQQIVDPATGFARTIKTPKPPKPPVAKEDQPRTTAEFRKFLKTGERPYAIKKKRDKHGFTSIVPGHQLASTAIGSTLAPVARAVGAGVGKYVGTVAGGSLGPLADATAGSAPAKFIKHGARGAAELAVTTPSTAAHLGTELVGAGVEAGTGHPGRGAKRAVKLAGEIAKPTVDLVTHPKHIPEAFYDDPVLTFLALQPVWRAPGLVAGKVLRRAGKQTLRRPDATLPGTALKAERHGSRDAFVRYWQDKRDRGHIPNMSNAEIERRVDEFHDLDRKLTAEHITNARRHAQAATRGQPKAVRQQAINEAVDDAADEARLASAQRFARLFGATERPHVGRADVDQAKATRDWAEGERKRAKAEREAAQAEARVADQFARQARGPDADRLASEAEREQAYKDLVRVQNAARRPEREFQQAHAGARVGIARPGTSPRLAELESQRQAIVRGKLPTPVEPIKGEGIEPEKPRTARHFDVGTRVSHGEHGIGVIREDASGRRYPHFENGTTGTAHTRVVAAPSLEDFAAQQRRRVYEGAAKLGQAYGKRPEGVTDAEWSGLRKARLAMAEGGYGVSRGTAKRPSETHLEAVRRVAQNVGDDDVVRFLDDTLQQRVLGREDQPTTHREATPEEFDAPFRQALAGEHGAYLTDYKPHERAGHKLLLSRDGKAGAAVKPDGDIVSVFRLPGGTKGDGQRMLRAAIERGGAKLDALGEGLRKFYESQGFRVVDSVAWDDKYAPKGWNYKRDGRPRVYFMEYAGPRGSATRAAAGAVPGEAKAGAGAVPGAGGQRGGALAGAPGPDVPGLGRPAAAPRAAGGGPAATAAAVADARRGVRAADRVVLAAERDLRLAEEAASRAQGVTEGRTKAGKMTAGAGRRAADMAERVGHARENLHDARATAAAARGHLKEADAAHRTEVRARTAEIDQEIAAEKRRIAGVAPAEADRLRTAIEGRDVAQNAVAQARTRARLLDRIVAGDRRALVLRRRGLTQEAKDRATAAREHHRDMVAARDVAKAYHQDLRAQHRDPTLIDAAAEGRLFDNQADAFRVRDQLNAQGHVLPSGHLFGRSLELREDPTAPTGSRVSLEQGGTTPLEYVVQPVGDQFAVVPKTAKERLYGSGEAGARQSHATVGTAKATGSVVLRNTRGHFTQANLPASMKWLTGQAVEPGARSLLTGAGPFDYVRHRMIVNRMNRIEPGSGDLYDREVTSGGMFGQTGTIREQLDRGLDEQGPLPSLAETFQGTKLAVPAKGLTYAGQLPGLPLTRTGWRAWRHFIFGVLNHAIEVNSKRAMAGHAVRQGPLMEREFLGLMNGALMRAAHGLQAPEARIAVGRAADDIYGQYSKFSPDKREMLLHWTPFAPWYINAATFLGRTLPLHHPLRAAVLANASAIDRDWREANQLSYFGEHRPPYQMGGYPTDRGGVYNLGHYWMGSAFADPAAAASELFLPQFATPAMNLRGIDWRNRMIQNPDGGEVSGGQRALRAGVSLGESLIPLVGMAGNISGIEPRYIDRRVDVPTLRERLRSYFPWTPIGDPPVVSGTSATGADDFVTPAAPGAGDTDAEDFVVPVAP